MGEGGERTWEEEEEEDARGERERGNCSLCSALTRDDYSSQVTQFGRATKRSREGHNQKEKKKKKNHSSK